MPYYHKGCGGEIAFWALRCKKCGKTWPWWLFFSLKPLFSPKKAGPARDITPFMPSLPKVAISKGKTTYARWADSIPVVALVASRLPNWPRWARILTFFGLVAILSALVYWTRQVILGG